MSQDKSSEIVLSSPAFQNFFIKWETWIQINTLCWNNGHSTALRKKTVDFFFISNFFLPFLWRYSSLLLWLSCWKDDPPVCCKLNFVFLLIFSWISCQIKFYLRKKENKEEVVYLHTNILNLSLCVCVCTVHAVAIEFLKISIHVLWFLHFTM